MVFLFFYPKLSTLQFHRRVAREVGKKIIDGYEKHRLIAPLDEASYLTIIKSIFPQLHEQNIKSIIHLSKYDLEFFLLLKSEIFSKEMKVYHQEWYYHHRYILNYILDNSIDSKMFTNPSPLLIAYSLTVQRLGNALNPSIEDKMRGRFLNQKKKIDIALELMQIIDVKYW